MVGGLGDCVRCGHGIRTAGNQKDAGLFDRR